MKRAYLTMGALLVGLGILGLFQNPVFGIFEVNLLHNLIHIGSGALTIVAAFQGIGTKRIWGKLFGLFYLGIAIAGATLSDGNLFGLMHLNIPDNLLHLALALFFLYYGLIAPPIA